MKTIITGFLVGFLAVASPAFGQEHEHEGHEHGKEAEGHSHQMAMSHGGTVTMTAAFHFEVVFTHDSVRVYAYDAKQKPLDPNGVKGKIQVLFRDSRREPVESVLRYVSDPEEGEEHHEEGHRMEHEMEGHHSHGFLEASLDLSKVAEGDAKASISLKGLPGKSETSAVFRETFRVGRLTEFVCPMKDTPPTKEASRCSKCGMQRLPVQFIYSCPVHPKVTSQKPGQTCWIGGEALEKRMEAPQAGAAHSHGGDHGDHDHDGDHED